MVPVDIPSLQSRPYQPAQHICAARTLRWSVISS